MFKAWPHWRGFGAVSVKLIALLSVLPVFSVAQAGDDCHRQVFFGRNYVICTFDVSAHDVSVHWRDEAQNPYVSLLGFRNKMLAHKVPLLFAMNGGMYHSDLRPVGYHVEHGKKISKANTRPGPGNFHMLPNGIFFIEKQGTKNKIGVMETRAFLKRNKRPLFASQSGPMLVINGRLHPLFRKSWTSRKIRNGVGVSKDGKKVVFAMSDEGVTFYEFGKLFQTHLAAHNALFLDGSVSQMWSRTLSRPGFSRVGPIIAVRKRK